MTYKDRVTFEDRAGNRLRDFDRLMDHDTGEEWTVRLVVEDPEKRPRICLAQGPGRPETFFPVGWHDHAGRVERLPKIVGLPGYKRIRNVLDAIDAAKEIVVAVDLMVGGTPRQRSIEITAEAAKKLVEGAVVEDERIDLYHDTLAGRGWVLSGGRLRIDTFRPWDKK